MTTTAAPQNGRNAAWFSVMPLSSLYGTWRTCRGSARPSGSNGSIEEGSADDGGCGTNGVNSVMTSASFNPLNRLSVGSGHRRILAVPGEDVFWCEEPEAIFGRLVLVLLCDVLDLCSPMLREEAE